MCFVKYLAVRFSAGLPAKTNNPFPVSQAQVRFQQFRAIELFASKAATSAVIVKHFSNYSEFFIDSTFRASISSVSVLSKFINDFPCNSGREGLTSGLA